jgi:uncharacterized DUF497 family protein
MRIEFDDDKSRANLQTHGMSLAAAEGIEWDSLVATEDTRREYGEMRMVGYALIQDRLHCVVFVDRPYGARRIISLRKANQREVARYEQEID